MVFGAPQHIPDRVGNSIACAIEMQNAMPLVNQRTEALGLPDLEMGIGINDTEVIVGNIGTQQRTKYAVVGSGVNMSNRIQSYSVGGQVLVSESAYHQTAVILRVDAKFEVVPKGADKPITIFDVGGIAGTYNLALEKRFESLQKLQQEIPVFCKIPCTGEHVRPAINGSLMGLSKQQAELSLREPVRLFTDLKIGLYGIEHRLSEKFFYARVIGLCREDSNDYTITFTSLPPEIDAFFQAHRQFIQTKI